jgi:hypothetical protein
MAMSRRGQLCSVGDDDIGAAPRRPADDQLHKIDDILRIEALRRFIDDQDLRLQNVMCGVNQPLAFTPA